jgi:uncharacterized membrane protein
MGAHHGHDHHLDVDEQVARSLWTSLGLLGVVVVIALVAMWPRGGDTFDDPLLLDADPVAADVIGDELVPCSYDALVDCRLVDFRITSGVYDGEVGAIEVGVDDPVRTGDGVLLTAFETEAGRLVFDFYDFQRGAPMVVLALVFAVVVIALGRWRGVGALVGLVVSYLIIVWFVVPAILDGSNAVTVAVVAASTIAFCVLFLAHGFEVPTAVALTSTLLSLLLTALLAWGFVGATNLTGLTDDSSLLLAGLREGIDARGILLAGIVIGALGVLDDVTVTQVSAVWELKALRPELTVRELVGPALRIGRDHIASTVNTLFLAYVGAALPLLLLFTEASQGFSSVITREIVATEVVRTLVGSIGLVASVPISTWLAAYIASTTSTTDAPAAGDVS